MSAEERLALLEAIASEVVRAAAALDAAEDFNTIKEEAANRHKAILELRAYLESRPVPTRGTDQRGDE